MQEQIGQIKEEVHIMCTLAWKREPLRQQLARGIAKRQAALDLSDPFTYDRVYSHLLNNVTYPECYK